MTDAELERLHELRKKGHWTIEELWELDILYRQFYEAFHQRVWEALKLDRAVGLR